METAHVVENIAPPGNPSDFVMRERPVFKAHWTREVKDKNGKVLHESQFIGEEELESICKRCNDRIEATGDFPPVVIRHTRDDKTNDPEVIGFAGPYYMGEVGSEDGPVPAIYAKTWIYKEDAQKLKKYPRLSVEFWADEDDPTSGYFDPVSLLGAETPELDLGIHYSASDAGGKRRIRYQKECYEASMPGGANTFVPGADFDSNQQYAKGDGMEPDNASSDNELVSQVAKQVVNLLMPVLSDLVDAAVDTKSAPPQEGDDEVAPNLAGDATTADDIAKMEDTPVKTDEMPEGSPPPGLPADDDEPVRNAKDDMEVDVDGDGAPDTLRQRYQKVRGERDSFRQRYEKVAAELSQIKARERRAVRYSKLQDLQAKGYVFDVQEELSEVENSSDAEFDKHVARIQSRYQRVPGGMLPVPQSPIYDPSSSEEKAAKVSNRVREIHADYAKRGEHIDYAKAKKIAEEELSKGAAAAKTVV